MDPFNGDVGEVMMLWWPPNSNPSLSRTGRTG